MNKENRKASETSDKNCKATTSMNAVFVIVGLILLVIFVPSVAVQLVRCPGLPQNIAYTYLALAMIPVGLVFFLRGRFGHWVEKRRTVEPAELEGLYSEVERYGGSGSGDALRIEAIKQAERERAELQSLKRPIFELDALPLRQALVDLYAPEAELVAKARSELAYLAYTAEYDEDIEEDAKRVKNLIDKLEETIKNRADQEEKGKEERVEIGRQLRAELKELRDTTAWYDRTWAIGEWLHVCVTCWVCATVLVTMLVGILPIIHSQGNWNICILHWAVLGATGALLSTLLKLHVLNLPELGETEGKQLLQWTVRHIAIGAIVAFLLYAAIWGGALDGKIFPDLPTGQVHYEVSQTDLLGSTQDFAADQATQKVDWNSLKNVGLSLFWAVFAGLSPVVFQRLCRVAESSLGELRSEGGGE